MVANTARAVVTGGAGFIGSHLAERLRAGGRDVLVVDNLASGSDRVRFLKRAGIPVEVVDIRSPDCARVIQEYRPAQVFHLAAQMDVRRSVNDPIYDAEVNVIGSLRVFGAAAAVGAGVVSTSSGGCIYGEPEPGLLPVNEAVVGRPSSPYGVSKKVTEDYLHFYRQTCGMRFVNLALANVFGPRQDPHGEAGVVAIFGSALLAGRECLIFGDGRQTRDFVYVGDVVDAFLAAGRALAGGPGEGERFNIGTGIETSVLTLQAMMAQAAGVDSPPVFRPMRAGELLRSCLDSAKATRLLGWVPTTSLAEGLVETVAFMRAEAAGSAG